MSNEIYRLNFQTLCRAIQHCDVALLECIDPTTGKPSGVVCATNRTTSGLLEFVPLALLLDKPLAALILPEPVIDPNWHPESN